MPRKPKTSAQDAYTTFVLLDACLDYIGTSVMRNTIVRESILRSSKKGKRFGFERPENFEDFWKLLERGQFIKQTSMQDGTALMIRPTIALKWAEALMTHFDPREEDEEPLHRGSSPHWDSI